MGCCSSSHERSRLPPLVAGPLMSWDFRSAANRASGATGWSTSSPSCSNGSRSLMTVVQIVPFERCAAAREEGFDGVARLAGLPGDLGHAQSVEITQNDCQPLRRRQGIERADGLLAVEEGADVVPAIRLDVDP